MTSRILILSSALFGLSLIASGCASPVQKACKNMAEVFPEEEQLADCESILEGLVEGCPEAADEMLSCSANAGDSDAMGACGEACMTEVMSAAMAQ